MYKLKLGVGYMGIKNMQGVAAHLEYVKKEYDTVEFVNCKFWKNEICYNNISFKYGGTCHSKRGCMYSIPLPKGVKKKSSKLVEQSIESQHSVTVKSVIGKNTINNILDKYFKDLTVVNLRYKFKEFKIKVKYRSDNKSMEFVIQYFINGKLYGNTFRFSLEKCIKISGNEVIFTMRIDDIIENLRLFNMGKVIRIINQNNFNNIVRKALISDEKDMNLKIDSWIKYMAYIIVKSVDDATK